MGMKKLKSLRLIEQPSPEMFSSAEKQLKALGALKTGEGDKLHLTKEGRIMAKLPVEPELAK